MKRNILKGREKQAGAVILALAFALGIYAFRGAIFLPSSEPDGVSEDSQAPASEAVRHPLTGERIESTIPRPHVFGVMIDNSVDAWPQTGINQAFLVIEAPVEAGITRFLSFFSDDQTIEKIGPVRSARPYFVEWNNELDGLYAHVGGSPEALNLIRSNGTADLNEFFHGTSFWRDASRLAPHNTYTSTEKLRSALTDQLEEGSSEPLYGLWSFKDRSKDVPLIPADPVIHFSGKSYRVEWSFDKASGRYLRSQAGQRHVLNTQEQIATDNILVIETDVQVVDEVGRRHIRTVGSGNAVLFQDGRKIHGTWKKPSVSERLRMVDADGNEVLFNAGSTWVEVVPSLDFLSTRSPQ